MKLLISLVALCNFTFPIVAQNTGAQPGAGTVPAGQTKAQTVPAQTAPVQGAAVQGSPVQSSPLLDSPVAGGTLDSGAQGASPIPSQTTIAPELNAPTEATGPGGQIQTQPQGPSGVGPLNPVEPPPVDSLPPPVRSGFQTTPAGAEIIEASGAAAPQGTTGSGSAVGETSVGVVGDEALLQQFQEATSRPGTTQLAFPQDNAVVTIVSQGSNLILQGTVSTEQQRQNIGQSIRQISAAGFVDNQLQVVPTANADAEQTGSTTVTE